MRLGNREETPYQKPYRAWGKHRLPKYLFNLHQTAPTVCGVLPSAVGNADGIWRVHRKTAPTDGKIKRRGVFAWVFSQETSPLIVGCLWINNLVEFYLSVVDCVKLNAFDGMPILIKMGDRRRALVIHSVRQRIPNRIGFQRSSVFDGECE